MWSQISREPDSKKILALQLKLHDKYTTINSCPLSYNYFEAQYKWAASWQNQQNDLRGQRRLRSAWASAQSDQSLRCPDEKSLGPQLLIERTGKTLIRLGGSESPLGAHATLLVLSWGGSNFDVTFLQTDTVNSKSLDVCFKYYFNPLF